MVLAAIISHRDVRLLDYASRFVAEEHFEDRTQRTLFRLMRMYADDTRGLLPRAALEDVLRNKPPGTFLQYTEYYDLLAGMRPTVPAFRFSLRQLRELKQERATGEALAQAREILVSGAWKDGKEVKGHAAARHHALMAFADIERSAAVAESPEGDIKSSLDKIERAYAKAREARLSGHAAGISTGVDKLDDVISGGFGNGELILAAGFSSAGKSQLVAHQAWHTAVRQGKHVVLCASETTKANMEVRLIARHSREPQFGLQAGLNSRDIRAGTLDGEQFRAFRAVLADWRSGRYGNCYILQLPKGATMSTVESRLAAVTRKFMPDLLLIDYLALLRPERAGRERRDDLALLLQDAKQLAVTFADGRGIPLLSPWQVSREGNKEVRTRGYYTMRDLAETAEAERSPDIIFSLLEPEQDDTRGRKVPLKLSIMKNREAERFVSMNLVADFANSHFTLADSASGEALLAPLLEDEL